MGDTADPAPDNGFADGPSMPFAFAPPNPVDDEREKVRTGGVKPQRRWRLVTALGVCVVVGWTTAAFIYGVSVGESRRLQPPAPPASIVLNVEEVAVPDSLSPSDTAAVVKMANVLGLSQADALAVLGGSGLDPSTVALATVGVAGDPGVVIDQDPAPGTSSPNAVTLSVSAPVDVPAVAGMTVNDARDALAGLGAVAELRSRYEAGVAPGTVLEVSPPDGALPAEVVLTVASVPASMELYLLNPVSARVCARGGDALRVNGVTGKSPFRCEVKTIWPDLEPAELSMDFDLGRKAESLSFTVGFIDSSQTDAAATVDVIVDGVLASSVTVAFGQSADVSVPVTDALRLRFEVHSTVQGTDVNKTRVVGFVAIIDAVLVGSQANIGVLSGTDS